MTVNRIFKPPSGGFFIGRSDILIQTSIGILTGIGIFLILADLFRIPYIKTSKAFNNLSNRQRKKTSTIELWLHGLATFIAKNLKINGYKRLQLVSDLQTAGMEISPELHIAGAIIKAGICGLLAIPVFFIFPLITPAVIALAFAMYFKEAKAHIQWFHGVFLRSKRHTKPHKKTP
mgnify:CR=1 FL=1